MKIILVNPSNNHLNSIIPVGLLHLGTYLKHLGHQVRIFDISAMHSYELLFPYFNPDIIGITCMTPFINEAYSMSKSLSIFSYTVLGGPHVTAMPEEAIQYTNAVVTGEGERTLARLVDSRETGIFKGDPLEDLEDNCPLDYSLVDMDYYRSSRNRQTNDIFAFVLPDDKVCAVSFSRGCPYRCIYCHNSFTNLKIRFREVESMVEELKMLKEKYQIDAVHFIDDSFAIDKKRVELLCKRMREEKLGIYFSCSIRASDATDDFVEVLRQGGCAQLAFGFESGVQRILDLLNKKIQVEDIKQAVDVTNKHGINVNSAFMFGNPTETLDEMKVTSNLLRNLDLDSGLGTFITVPYPGTKLWDWCIENKVLPEKIDWNSFRYNAIPAKLHNVPIPIFQSFMQEIGTYAIGRVLNTQNRRLEKSKKIKDMIRS